MAKKVLILAGDTDGNLGDLAIVTATCDALRKINADVRISLVTSRAQRDQERLQIEPIRRGWRGIASLVKAARDADLVICGGGGLFQDDDSLVKMPYWAIRLALVKSVSGSIAGLSIGAGPLHYGISRLFARLALSQLNPVSVRDHLARSVLEPLTKKNVEIVPDPAFLLDAAPEAHARGTLRASGIPVCDVPLIGVAVRRWFHKKSDVIPHKYAEMMGLRKNRGNQKMSAFVDLTSAVLDEVIEKTNAHVVFMPTYSVNHEADNEVCRAIAAKLNSKSQTILELDDPCLYKSVTGLMAVMLSGRMHPAILAAGQGTPVVGIAYNPKFFGMFSLIEQEDQCISIDDLVNEGSSSELVDMLIDAIQCPSKHRPTTSKLECKTRGFIENLVAQTATTR